MLRVAPRRQHVRRRRVLLRVPVVEQRVQRVDVALLARERGVFQGGAVQRDACEGEVGPVGVFGPEGGDAVVVF